MLSPACASVKAFVIVANGEVDKPYPNTSSPAFVVNTSPAVIASFTYNLLTLPVHEPGTG